jgi:hypothetical protein
MIVIRLYENQWIDAATLSDAGRVAQDIFGRAGLETAWILCRRSHRDRRCRDRLGPTDFLVRVVDWTTAEPESLSFGYAHLDTQTQTGVLASVFGPRIKRTAARLRLNAAILLGRVLAHELGHLLGLSAHSTIGLMRGDWSDEMLQRENKSAFLFIDDQPVVLRQGVAARVAAMWRAAE